MVGAPDVVSLPAAPSSWATRKAISLGSQVICQALPGILCPQVLLLLLDAHATAAMPQQRPLHGAGRGPAVVGLSDADDA